MRSKNIVDASLVSPGKQVLESVSANTHGSDSEEGNNNVIEVYPEEESDGGDEGSVGVGEEEGGEEELEDQLAVEVGDEELEDEKLAAEAGEEGEGKEEEEVVDGGEEGKRPKYSFVTFDAEEDEYIMEKFPRSKLEGVEFLKGFQAKYQAALSRTELQSPIYVADWIERYKWGELRDIYQRAVPRVIIYAKKVDQSNLLHEIQRVKATKLKENTARSVIKSKKNPDTIKQTSTSQRSPDTAINSSHNKTNARTNVSTNVQFFKEFFNIGKLTQYFVQNRLLMPQHKHRHRKVLLLQPSTRQRRKRIFVQT